MLTKIFKRFKAAATAPVVDAPVETAGFTYSVTLPNQEPVILRAKNQVEVKAMVRDAHGLTRLPAGTTVERLA